MKVLPSGGEFLVAMAYNIYVRKYKNIRSLRIYIPKVFTPPVRKIS